MLHSAGIAGLAMTLAQLDRLYPQSHQRPAGLSWLSDEIKIELFWTGDDAIALAWLLSESFRIDGDGLVSLTGLVSTDMDISVRVAIHQGITKSFLQHGLCRFPAQSMLLPRSQLMGKMLKLVIKSLLCTSEFHEGFVRSTEPASYECFDIPQHFPRDKIVGIAYRR